MHKDQLLLFPLNFFVWKGFFHTDCHIHYFNVICLLLQFADEVKTYSSSLVHILQWGINIVQELIWLQRFDLFIFCFASSFEQFKMLNKIRKSFESWSHLYFIMVSFIIPKKTQPEKQTSPFSHTYSWNKDGIKLYFFWEYGPMCLSLRLFVLTMFSKRTKSLFAPHRVVH